MQSPEIIGRYALYGKIASGGMATVHIGRLLGPVGFSRTVAIKRMHPQFTGDPEFVSMFLDEARLAARIRHPNVVSTLDVVALNGELFLVLDYVQGETLAVLIRRTGARGDYVPVPIAAAILSGVLHGLHAAHEAKNEQGEPLGIVHRDISPQNVMVGIDGVSRVLDFGVAKAAGRLQTTESGKLKGKLAYMPPEQLRGKTITRRCDVYAASVVLWEALAGQRLFYGENEGVTMDNVLRMPVRRPSEYRPEIPAALDAVVMQGLARDPNERFATAREMATALEAASMVAIAPAVGAWVDGTAADTLSAQAARIAAIESASDIGADPITDARAFVDVASASQHLAVAVDESAFVGGSASKASALSVQPGAEELSPGAHARRNALVAVVSTLVAVTVTIVAMEHRGMIGGERAVAAGAPQTGVAAAPASPPPVIAPTVAPPAASVSVSVSAAPPPTASAAPVAEMELDPVPVPVAKPLPAPPSQPGAHVTPPAPKPAGTGAPSVAKPPKPTHGASAAPAYDPLDHL